MSVNPAHLDHDELLIARMASGDADAVDRAAGERQLVSCEGCRTLLADVQAIRSFTTRDTLRVPPRSRSFRIPADELSRLRMSAWRRWLARFGTPRFDLVRPLATAAAGLGLVVLVLGTALPAPGPWGLGFFGSAASAPERELAGGSPAPAPAPAAGESVSSQVPGATGQQDTSSQEGTATPGETSGPGATLGLSNNRAHGIASGEPAHVPLAPLGAIVLASGLGLVILHSVARRAAGR